MHSLRHATAATERTTCTSSNPDHAHGATHPTGSTNALRATSTDDGSEHPGGSEQRQWSCYYRFGDGDFGYLDLHSWIYSVLVFLFLGQLAVRPSRSYFWTHRGISRKQDRCWWRSRRGRFDSWLSNTRWLSSTDLASWLDWGRFVDLSPTSPTSSISGVKRFCYAT